MTGISDSRGPRLPPLHSGPQYKTPSALNLVKFEIVMPISTNAGSKIQVRPQLNNINKDRGIDKETQQQRRRAAADRKENLIWRCTDHIRGIPSSHESSSSFSVALTAYYGLFELARPCAVVKAKRSSSQPLTGNGEWEVCCRPL